MYVQHMDISCSMIYLYVYFMYKPFTCIGRGFFITGIGLVLPEGVFLTYIFKRKSNIVTVKKAGRLPKEET